MFVLMQFIIIMPFFHPLTHSPTHPLTHSPTHPLTHSPTHPLTHSPTHPLSGTGLGELPSPADLPTLPGVQQRLLTCWLTQLSPTGGRPAPGGYTLFGPACGRRSSTAACPGPIQSSRRSATKGGEKDFSAGVRGDVRTPRRRLARGPHPGSSTQHLPLRGQAACHINQDVAGMLCPAGGSAGVPVPGEGTGAMGLPVHYPKRGPLLRGGYVGCL